MQDERLSREEIIYLYQDDARKLLEYYPWLEKVSGQATSEIYKGEGIEETSMAVPVYDSRLLSFIKLANTLEQLEYKDYYQEYFDFAL